jgi:hypothetical protein
MATGTAPALDPKQIKQSAAQQTSNAQPLTFMARLTRKLTEIFEYNEKLGVTRG